MLLRVVFIAPKPRTAMVVESPSRGGYLRLLRLGEGFAHPLLQSRLSVLDSFKEWRGWDFLFVTLGHLIRPVQHCEHTMTYWLFNTLSTSPLENSPTHKWNHAYARGVTHPLSSS